MKRNTRTAISLVLIALIVASGLYIGYYFLSGPGRTPNISFTIIASDQGFNNSKTIAGLNGTWPTMTVHLGDLVRIHVSNFDPVEPHGFAIAHYLDGSTGPKPITVGTHSTVDVTFIVDQPGTFKVYCDIFCTVHAYMQRGQLIVS